jgi:hypothetical protein
MQLYFLYITATVTTRLLVVSRIVGFCESHMGMLFSDVMIFVVGFGFGIF